MPPIYKKAVWLLIVLLGVLPSFAQDSKKRVALVVGNGAYSSPNSLSNPSTDANDLAQALRELGFTVISGVNQNKKQTEQLIEDFGKALAETRGVGLFYYAGIGFQLNRENFLVPVDANFAGEKETAASSVSLNSVLDKMNAAQNDSNIILLDPKHKAPLQNVWKKPASNTYKTGFSNVSAPTGATVFYSSGIGQSAADNRCGFNGYFVASFLKQLETPKLEFNQLLRNVYDEISLKTTRQQQPSIDGILSKDLYLVNEKPRLKTKARNSLESIFDNFKAERKCPCGERGAALATGKEILEKYGSDPDNPEVIKYVRIQVAAIEKEDPVCIRNNDYNAAYKAKDWARFMAISKEIIAAEGDSPLALDLMLTHVSVGYDLAVVHKIDTYNAESVEYAKRAIERLEAGGASQTGNFGVFVPYRSRSFPDGKTNSLNSMNFIIGWITYNRLGANDPVRKKEGLYYLYKSTQYRGEFTNDLTIYTSIGDYYFNEATILDEEYRKIRAANKNIENQAAKAKRALALGYIDRSIDAFSRALKLAIENKASPRVIEAIKKTLTDRYRMRFNTAPGIQPEGFEIYFEKLISRPMPNPETRVEPIWQ